MSKHDEFIQLMKNIQPSANKKTKKATYDSLPIFLNENILSEIELEILYSGLESKEILGILELSGKKNQSGVLKDSSTHLLKIIHDINLLSKRSETYSKEFVLYDDYIKAMHLSSHYKSASNSKDKHYKQRVLNLLKIILDKRPQFDFNEILDKGTIMEEILVDVKKLVEKSNRQKSINLNQYDKIQEEIKETVNLEPKTWDDVLKLKNKKLLTTEFISMNTKNKESGMLIDEEKEAENEILSNFINPLTENNELIKFNEHTEEEIDKLHVQFETFDCKFFLEKFYSKVTIVQFQKKLLNLQNNLQKISKDDETLVDNNIYKYLDCKKILDNILLKFKENTSEKFKDFIENLFELQNKINELLGPIKIKHENYKRSKSSMEIIQKFQKFFVTKDKIEHCLKFSNFEDLAEALKKINLEVKEISQTKFIYGEFYDFFVKSIENFKKVLNNIISQSNSREIIIKHFKLLLDFDIEVEAIDDLLNILKEKMSNKIENYLEFTDNFEIKNFKEFFCDEYHVEILNDQVYSSLLKESDMYISNTRKKQSEDHCNREESSIYGRKSSINEAGKYLFLFNY